MRVYDVPCASVIIDALIAKIIIYKRHNYTQL